MSDEELTERLQRPMKHNEPPGPSKPTGLVATLDRLAEQMAEGRAWMDAKECAAFLSMSHDEFRKIAPRLPRYEIPQDPRAAGLRPRWRYYAPEITEAIIEGRIK